MANLIPTGGSTVYYSDIAQMIIDGRTSEEMANALNSDYRHFGNTSIDQVFRTLFDSLEMIEKNLGLGTDPANDTVYWQGMFDDLIRALPDNTSGTIVKKGWNRILTSGQYSTDPLNTIPEYEPQAVQVSDRIQKTGLWLKEADENTQTICVDPAYDGDLSSIADDTARSQAVHDLWVQLTGGRRFGAVTEAVVDQAIADEAERLDRVAAYDETQVTRQKSNDAIAAGDAAYQAGSDAATVRLESDNAYNA